MADVKDVAEYIINSLEVDNLKLQKLTYYAQAVHLVLNDKTPLFDDEIEAWQYGPVIPRLYAMYKQHGFDPIPRTDKDANLTTKEIESIDMTLSYYGRMSGVELIGRTHQDAPWKNVYQPNKRHIVITKDSIYDYYKQNLEFEE
jgi:uncharacterized phage-associated protein